MMKHSIIPTMLCAVLLSTAHSFAAESTISLAGQWRFALDPGNRGIKEQWFTRSLDHKINLPGSLQAQGFGNDVSVNTKWIGSLLNKTWFTDPAYAKYRQPGNIKISFWLQPAKHYVGPAWYQRDITIPADWSAKRVHLTLERVHINSQLWLDGKEIGRYDSLSTPHQFDLGHPAPGKHTLSLRVDNGSLPAIGGEDQKKSPKGVGPNAHCVSDNTQTNWNGVIGRIELSATPDTWIDALEIYPDVPAKQVRVQWRLGGQSPAGKIVITIHSPDGKSFTATADATVGTATISLGPSIATWDEFSPRLYQVKATLTLPDGATHQSASTFGMVDYKVAGRHFLVNGRPTIFRGTLDCASFPMTGYPSTDITYWRKEISVLKAHGFNHIRFHSWCPPEAAFIAADELGCYLQVEHAWWYVDPMGPYLMREAERVIRAYGNHPSFAMHTHGNEPVGGVKWMENFSAHFRKRDPRRYYTGASGRAAFKNSQFEISQGPSIRMQSWGAGLKSPINSQPPSSIPDFGKKTASCKIPLMCHEAGQWCVYPDFDEIKKYTGFLKAKNFEIFRDFLNDHHMGDQARDFLMATGRLQTICYKYEIERLLRTPDIGGYQLLGLNDFPGQGTALVGAVNPFWETKPYTSPAEYSSFAGPTVLLARLPKFVFKNDETLAADIEISHYAAAPLPSAMPQWKLVDASGKALRSGNLPARNIPIGQSSLGTIQIPLTGLAAPAQLKLIVGIADQTTNNQWDIWVYPAQTPKPATGEIVLSHNPSQAWQKASQGDSVLLIPPAKSIADPSGPKVVLGFSTIFWNTAWTNRQPPTTMGIFCNPSHPALAEFPTECHSNFQWWYLIRLTGKPLSLEGQDPKLRPVVQVIDDWHTARRLGLVVEAKCGKGKLLISAVDFENAKGDDIVAAQFRTSLIGYMKSAAFAPKDTLDSAAFARFFAPNAGK